MNGRGRIKMLVSTVIPLFCDVVNEVYYSSLCQWICCIFRISHPVFIVWILQIVVLTKKWVTERFLTASPLLLPLRPHVLLELGHTVRDEHEGVVKGLGGFVFGVVGVVLA